MIKCLEKMTEKSSKKTWDLTQELVEEVLLHAKTEEKVLYRAMKEKNVSFRDFTLEGDIEHKLLESCLMRLLKVRPKIMLKLRGPRLKGSSAASSRQTLH